MAKVTQGTVDIIPTDGSMGDVGRLSTSDSARMRALFAHSPIHSGDITKENIKEEFKRSVLNAVINDNGHTFGTFNTSYNGAPNISDVEIGGGGLPASGHVPNPVSPGVGSSNPGDQAEAPDGFGTVKSDVPGSGVGSSLQPSESSSNISEQDIDNLSLGSSASE